MSWKTRKRAQERERQQLREGGPQPGAQWLEALAHHSTSLLALVQGPPASSASSSRPLQPAVLSRPPQRASNATTQLQEQSLPLPPPPPPRPEPVAAPATPASGDGLEQPEEAVDEQRQLGADGDIMAMMSMEAFALKPASPLQGLGLRSVGQCIHWCV